MDYLDTKILPEDMSDEEKASVTEYINQSCPGLAKVQSSDVFQWFGLYMAGKTYKEIAEIKSIDLILVLYMGVKLNWHKKKIDHYNNLVQTLTEKITSAKLQSANTMASVITGLAQYYGKKFDQYLSQKDETIIASMDTKLLAQYYKAIDMIDKLITQNKTKDKNTKSSPVSVNIFTSNDSQIKDVNSDVIDVNDDNAADILLGLANIKKKEDSKK